MNESNSDPPGPGDQAELRERLLILAAGIPLPLEPRTLDSLDLIREIQAARRRSLLAHVAESIARALRQKGDA